LLQDKKDIDNALKKLDEEKEKNKNLKETVLQLDSELNQISQKVSPKKVAMDYQQRSVLPDLELRVQIKDEEMKRAALRHEALHDRL
jgi:hypothetical protein